MNIPMGTKQGFVGSLWIQPSRAPMVYQEPAGPHAGFFSPAESSAPPGWGPFLIHLCVSGV